MLLTGPPDLVMNASLWWHKRRSRLLYICNMHNYTVTIPTQTIITTTNFKNAEALNLLLVMSPPTSCDTTNLCASQPLRVHSRPKKSSMTLWLVLLVASLRTTWGMFQPVFFHFAPVVCSKIIQGSKNPPAIGCCWNGRERGWQWQWQFQFQSFRGSNRVRRPSIAFVSCRKCV